MCKNIKIQPITAKDYILEHWQEYNLTDTKEEFIALLNVLQAWGENLDSLHDVCLNGLDIFCGIVGSFENDRDVVSALFQFNTFHTTESLVEWLLELKEDSDTEKEWIEDIVQRIFGDFSDSEVVKTDDGYVHTVWY